MWPSLLGSSSPCVARARHALQDGQHERGRLAGARLGAAHDVAAGEDARDGLLLDGRGRLVAHGRHACQQIALEAELGERRQIDLGRGAGGAYLLRPGDEALVDAAAAVVATRPPWPERPWSRRAASAVVAAGRGRGCRGARGRRRERASGLVRCAAPARRSRRAGLRFARRRQGAVRDRRGLRRRFALSGGGRTSMRHGRRCGLIHACLSFRAAGMAAAPGRRVVNGSLPGARRIQIDVEWR